MMMQYRPIFLSLFMIRRKKPSITSPASLKVLTSFPENASNTLISLRFNKNRLKLSGHQEHITGKCKDSHDRED